MKITEEKQAAKISQPKKRWQKKHYLFIVLLFLLLFGSISSVVGYLVYNARYHSDLSLAQTGLQHMQKGEALLVAWSHSPLNTGLISQAKAEFAAASKTLNVLNSDLQVLPQFILEQVPSYGAKLHAAVHLVPLAIALSQMGVSGCSILNTLMTGLQHPFSSQDQGLTTSALSGITQDVKGLRSSLSLATQQIKQLQPADMQFDARIPQLVSAFSKEAPMLQELADHFEQVVTTILGIGTPANYLIEVLDSTELRPGGGFIGNYGIATLSNGRLTTAQISDVVLLDSPAAAAGIGIPFPPAYSWFDLTTNHMGLLDSNLDADFPTAARYGEEIYHLEGGTVPTQGVIAITPVLMEQILAITGPITIPEYQETITAQNLIDRIHYYQLGGVTAGEGSSYIPSPDGISSERKHFIGLLAEDLLARVRQLPSTDLSKLLQVMTNSLRTKDLQLYFNSSIAEDALHRLQLGSAVEAPAGDGFLVVDANISPNKANSMITNTLVDQITIDGQGDAIHHATINYAWTLDGQNYGNDTYRDYVRVYLPSRSLLQSQDGWDPRGESNSFGCKAVAGFFTLQRGQTQTITLSWIVPHMATRGANGWHYQETLQRQAGVLWTVDINITLPPSAMIQAKRGGLLTTGKQTAILNQPLNENLDWGVDYVYK